MKYACIAIIYSFCFCCIRLFIYWNYLIIWLILRHNFADGIISQNSNRTIELEGLPDSKLISIKLELVSWKIVTDIKGDKKILKKVNKAGEGIDRPNEGSLVKGNLYLKWK
jgi:hypothetical protein